MHFRMKNILKSNHNHILKQTLKVRDIPRVYFYKKYYKNLKLKSVGFDWNTGSKNNINNNI